MNHTFLIPLLFSQVSPTKNYFTCMIKFRHMIFVIRGSLKAKHKITVKACNTNQNPNQPSTAHNCLESYRKNMIILLLTQMNIKKIIIFEEKPVWMIRYTLIGNVGSEKKRNIILCSVKQDTRVHNAHTETLLSVTFFPLNFVLLEGKV